MKWKRAICLQQIWFTETIASNSCGKTVLQDQVLLYTIDSRRQNTKRNKQILNLNSASIKDIIFATKAEIILKK